MTGTQTQHASPTDVLSENVDYLKETVAVFASVGLGLGLCIVLLGQIGSLPISVSASGTDLPASATGDAHDGVVDGLSVLGLYLLPLVIVGVATLVAFDLEERFEEDRDGIIAGAAASVAGGIVLTLVAGILFSIQMPSSAADIAGGQGEMGMLSVSVGLDFVNLLIDGVAFGVGAGVTTGTIAYARTTIGRDVPAPADETASP